MASLSAARPAAEPDKKILIAIHDTDLLNEFENDMYITELRETSKIDAGEFAGIKSTLIRGEHTGFIELMEKAPPSVLGCKNGGLSLFSMLKDNGTTPGSPASGESRKEAFLAKARVPGFFLQIPVDGVDDVVIVIYNNSDVDMGDVRRYITDKMAQIVAALRTPLADLSGIFPKKPAAPSGAGAAAAPGSASGLGSITTSDPKGEGTGKGKGTGTGTATGAEEAIKYMKMSGGAKKKSKKASKKRSKKTSKKMSGGAKKKSKKASKKRSKKASKKMSGGAKKKSKKASKKRSKKASKK